MSKLIKYIDSRMVSSKSRIAFKKGARNAMAINGYVVIEHDGWIVKKYENGTIEPISQVTKAASHVLKLD